MSPGNLTSVPRLKCVLVAEVPDFFFFFFSDEKRKETAVGCKAPDWVKLIDNTCIFSWVNISLPHTMQAKFEFHHGDYEKQFLHVLSRKDKTGIVVNNPTQSVFLFIDRQHLQVNLLCPLFSVLPKVCFRSVLLIKCFFFSGMLVTCIAKYPCGKTDCAFVLAFQLLEEACYK